MSDYCVLFSQTFYGLLFSYLTIADVTSYVHHKFPVSLVLYIATKKLNQIMAVNSSANAAITHKKITLVRFACLCFFLPESLKYHDFKTVLYTYYSFSHKFNSFLSLPFFQVFPDFFPFFVAFFI